jgi:hypothetical protein
MRGLLYPKGNIIGGSGDWDGHCSWSAIVLPLTLTGQNLGHVPPLGTLLHACMFLYIVGSLGTVSFVHLGAKEMTSCLQCREHAWPLKPGIAQASRVMYDVWTSSPPSQTVHGTVSSNRYRTFSPIGVVPRSESAPLSWMSFFQPSQRGRWVQEGTFGLGLPPPSDPLQFSLLLCGHRCS